MKKIIDFFKKLFSKKEEVRYYTIAEAGKLVNKNSRNGMFLANTGESIGLFYREKNGKNKGKIRINYNGPHKEWLTYVRQPEYGDVQMREEVVLFLDKIHRNRNFKNESNCKTI